MLQTVYNLELKWGRYGLLKTTGSSWVRISHYTRCRAKFSYKPGAVSFRRPYLPHFSSKSYTVWSLGFFTSWALKWYIACRKWTSGSAPKVRKKTTAAVLYFLHSVFPLSIVLSLHTLNNFGKGLWSSKAWFFMNLSFQKLCHELYTALPHSWIALV